jgi:DNA-binding Xre family transcriptional regulator
MAFPQFLEKNFKSLFQSIVVFKKMPKLASELKLLNMQVKDLNRLKLVLVERKKTGLWLAEQLGVSNTTVSKWCTNTSQPDLQTLAQISDLLKVNIRELLVSRN